MTASYFHVWALAVAGSALCAWWLTVRPGASYRGVASSVSFLIILMAVLLAVLALFGQPSRSPSGAPSSSVASLG
jgi:hypothetical protein